MRLFKHIILSIFALGAFIAPANAQTDVKALTGALAETIREYSNYADSLAFRIAVANRKNPTVLLGIAKAYNMNQDFEKTKKYAMDALAVQPDFAPSYVLLGEHCQYKFEHYQDNEAYKDTAIYYYKKAMEVNPLYEESYSRYADIMQKDDPEGVLKMYLRLRDERPDLHIGGTIAALQFALALKAEDDTLGTKLNLLKKAIATYEDQGNETLEDHELQRFCALLDVTADNCKEADEKNFYREKMLTVASFGHERDVTNPQFLSYMLAANTNLTRYEDAIKNANELFTQADTAKLHYRYMPYDYRWHGVALMSVDSLDAGVDRILEGLEVGKKLSEDLSVSFSTRDLASNQANQMNKDVSNIVNNLVLKERWDDARHIREYQLSKKDSAQINDYLHIVSIYQQQMQSIKEAAERDALMVPFTQLLTKIEKDFPTDPDVCSIYYTHAGLISNFMESSPAEGKAEPYFQKCFNLEMNNPSRSSADDQYLGLSSHYLCVHYYQNHNYEKAKRYAEAMMELDAYYATGETLYNACVAQMPKSKGGRRR